VDDLSDIVARQEGEISRLTYRVQMLMEREAGRETDAGGSATMIDQRPPHY
jgi:SlyX protein